KLANWRPKLAVKLDISAPTYDFLMETVRDPRFSDRLVMYLFERFMDKSTSRIDSVDIYRTMKINRPHLAEAFEVKPSIH
ncbi:MAG: hypothetical protein KBD29_03825, partial [Candidatus Magasanikbacteria bacterium]|nr:hypothetical protein [Candidatus Magasanikbacteria bacterium]